MLSEKNPEYDAHSALVSTAQADADKQKAEEVKKRILNALRFKKVPAIDAKKIIDALEILTARHSSVVANEKNANLFFQMLNAGASTDLANKLEKAVIAKTGRNLNEHAAFAKLSALLENAVRDALLGK